MRRQTLSILLLCLALTNCSLPTATPVATPDLISTATETAPSPLPTPELGTAENPLILTLPPFSKSPEQINAAKSIAAMLSEKTGYHVVVVASDSYAAAVDALGKGNSHIALLDALSYEVAYQKGFGSAAFAVLKNNKSMYGAEFIASKKSGFKIYFDPTTQTNIADAPIALAQFANKKPCWTDESSPSGYLVPFGYLNKYQISTQPPAFVQGHPTVIRSLYAGGICDFGAVYIDARKFPSLEDQYPDLMEQILIIWQVPEIIPYSVLVFSSKLSETNQVALTNAIPAILQTDAGEETFKSAFDIDELTKINDATLSEFHEYMKNTEIQLP